MILFNTVKVRSTSISLTEAILTSLKLERPALVNISDPRILSFLSALTEGISSMAGSLFGLVWGPQFLCCLGLERHRPPAHGQQESFCPRGRQGWFTDAACAVLLGRSHFPSSLATRENVPIQWEFQ